MRLLMALPLFYAWAVLWHSATTGRWLVNDDARGSLAILCTISAIYFALAWFKKNMPREPHPDNRADGRSR